MPESRRVNLFPSISEVLDASDDDGDKKNRGGQGRRRPNLEAALPSLPADWLDQTEEDEEMAYDLQMRALSSELDGSGEDSKRRKPKTLIPGETEEDDAWLNEQKSDMAAAIMRIRLTAEEIAVILDEIADAPDMDTLLDVVKNAELRVIEKKGKKKVRKPLGVIRESDPPSGDDWEDYDPTQWHDADDSGASIAKSTIPIAEATFVRALTDSEAGCKPYFRTGDILRIIGHRRRGDQYFELLPLKPPGEAGRALRAHFEGVNEQAVQEVKKEAKTDKELDSFRAAVEWEDD